MKYYIVYKITNIANSKIYIGVHMTTDLDDGYMGSGLILQRAKDKYGVKNFKREILKVCSSSEEMYNEERAIVNEEFLARQDVYNIRLGGFGGFDYINKNGLNLRTGAEWSEESRSKLSASKTGQLHTEEAKVKISLANKLTNKSRSEKISKALSGKEKTEEHRQKIRESLKEWNRQKKLATRPST